MVKTFTKALLAVFLICSTWSAWAQTADIQKGMADVLRYARIADPAPEDVARMADLWTAAQDPASTADDRRNAFAELYALYSKLQGREVKPSAMQGLARFAATMYEGGGRMDLRLPEPRGIPSSNYLHVETRGQGPTPLILLSDLGVDGRSLYGPFAERNGPGYRMYIVTLPAAGEARMLPWPEKLDYAARPWLGRIERELLALLDRPDLKGAVVVGTSSGGYFAARLALLRPERVHATVVVDALVHAPMRALGSPDSPATLAERLARVRTIAPTPQLFPFAPVPEGEALRKLIDDPGSTHPTARNWMAFAVKDLSLSRQWTYGALSAGFFLSGTEYRWELLTTDLTEELGSLSVPLLAMGAVHDDGSPAQSPPSLSQWEQIKLLYPQVPLTVAAFEDSRAYISVEYPREFDRALGDFLAGRPVHDKTGFHLARNSPRAAVMQSVGAAEVEIRYGRPSVKGRDLSGQLMPKGRVWRAGANEATTFRISRDVRIEGRALQAGTYTFFVIPNEGQWTLVFNRVPRQWGAFDYNPAFDALRVAVTPAENPHQEYLSYSLEPDGENAARVILIWEKRRVEFRIEDGGRGNPLTTDS